MPKNTILQLWWRIVIWNVVFILVILLLFSSYLLIFDKGGLQFSANNYLCFYNYEATTIKYNTWYHNHVFPHFHFTTTVKHITWWLTYLRNLCLKWITFRFNVVHHRKCCTCSLSLCFFHRKVVSIVSACAPTWFMSHLSCLIFLTPQRGCARLACCATLCDHCFGMAKSSLIKLNYSQLLPSDWGVHT